MGKKNNQREQQKPTAPAAEQQVEQVNDAPQSEAPVDQSFGSESIQPAEAPQSVEEATELLDAQLKEAFGENYDPEKLVLVSSDAGDGIRVEGQDIEYRVDFSGTLPDGIEGAIKDALSNKFGGNVQQLPEAGAIQGQAAVIQTEGLAEQLSTDTAKTDDEKRADIQAAAETLEGSTAIAGDPAPVEFVMEKDPAGYEDIVLRQFHDIMTAEQLVIFGEIIRQRNELHAGWTTEEVWQWFLNDVSPVPTASGLWKNDPDRRNRGYHDWTMGELAAALAGEVDLPYDADATEVGIRLRTRVMDVSGFVEASEWAVQDLVRYALLGLMADRTASGALLHSDLRERSLAQRWTTEELTAWFRGEIPSTEKASDAVLLEVFALRLGGNARWTRGDIEILLETGKEPTITTFGCLANDAIRNELPVEHWTTIELISAIREEISVPDGIDVNQAYLDRFNMSSNAGSRLKETLSQLEEVNVHMTIEFISNAFNQYAEKMDPKKAITNRDGGSLQTGLFRTINKILRLDGPDFVDGWSQFLGFIAENREGMFHETAAYRFLADMNVSSVEGKQFQALLNLALHTCKPADRRKAGTVVDFKRLGEIINNEPAAQRLIAYYEV